MHLRIQMGVLWLVCGACTFTLPNLDQCAASLQETRIHTIRTWASEARVGFGLMLARVLGRCNLRVDRCTRACFAQRLLDDPPLLLLGN
ncbi:hypothetical protein SDC9_161919 [bioreactor metagenome]|uniref:Uncharacterized protein n=1 Tax=bioreactor metagenome TaxID=1076179 RepID=A0A645FM07_9ZZZZ